LYNAFRLKEAYLVYPKGWVEQLCLPHKTNYTMKNDSLTYAFIGIFLVFSAILLVRCNASAGDNAPVTEMEAALTDTSTTQFNTDTSMLTEAVQEMEEPEIVPQTVAPPAAKPVVKKRPIATKTDSTKQKPAIETPPANVPATKTPDVAPTASTSPPKEETQPAPMPTATPKSPVVKHVAFSLKSKKAVIKGSSSLHAWESNVTQIEGKGAFETKDEELVAIKDVEIKITVKGIKSKEGKKMDDKTYDTFNSDENPYIIYTFSNAVIKVNDANIVAVEAPGKLTMAGNTQSVSLSATGKKLPNGDLQLSVSKKLKMTDYKMKPPVMLLGTIKVGDEITVEFDFVLESIK
jgi:polyisoprenoid-binding protein YceI